MRVFSLFYCVLEYRRSVEAALFSHLQSFHLVNDANKIYLTLKLSRAGIICAWKNEHLFLWSAQATVQRETSFASAEMKTAKNTLRWRQQKTRWDEDSKKHAEMKTAKNTLKGRQQKTRWDEDSTKHAERKTAQNTLKGRQHKTRWKEDSTKHAEGKTAQNTRKGRQHKTRNTRALNGVVGKRLHCCAMGFCI